MQALKSEEMSQLQLVEREEIDEEEDLFEAIDKCLDVIGLDAIETEIIDALLFVTRSNVLSSVGFRDVLLFVTRSYMLLSVQCPVIYLMNVTLFRSVYSLTAHGINALDVKKLQDAGIYTCNGLMMHTKKLGIRGIDELLILEGLRCFHRSWLISGVLFSRDFSIDIASIHGEKAIGKEHQNPLRLVVCQKLQKQLVGIVAEKDVAVLQDRHIPEKKGL
ncbi:hypothetical protein Tco_1393762 [Tanacetum coccineum]